MSCAYQNGNCSQNAECMEDETGAAVGCRCHPGYVGDGYHCSSPCDTQNGGCHVNATCQLLIQGAEVMKGCAALMDVCLRHLVAVGLNEKVEKIFLATLLHEKCPLYTDFF